MLDRDDVKSMRDVRIRAVQVARTTYCAYRDAARGTYDLDLRLVLRFKGLRYRLRAIRVEKWLSAKA